MAPLCDLLYTYLALYTYLIIVMLSLLCFLKLSNIFVDFIKLLVMSFNTQPSPL